MRSMSVSRGVAVVERVVERGEVVGGGGEVEVVDYPGAEGEDEEDE